MINQNCNKETNCPIQYKANKANEEHAFKEPIAPSRKSNICIFNKRLYLTKSPSLKVYIPEKY